jgi:hypothetical protein
MKEKDSPISMDPRPLKSSLSFLGAGKAAVVLNLQPQHAGPGKYQLIIDVADETSGENATLETDLEYVETGRSSQN